MNQQLNKTVEERPLGILGIGEEEEDAYRWLLANSGTTVGEFAQAMTVSPPQARRLLDTLEAKGLATHSPEHPRRYNPSAPDIAMEALVLRHQEMLKRARGTILELQQAASAQQRSSAEPMVEVITNKEAESQIYDHMQDTAQKEIVALVRPPLRVSRMDIPTDQDHQTQRHAQNRGVLFRSIVDREFLSLPGGIANVRSDIAAGEKIRVCPELPPKMVLADRRIAIMPLNLQLPDSPTLLVRSSALLDTLYSLFEMLWTRASPIAFTRENKLLISDPAVRSDKHEEALIALMSAGLNDKKIAGELGVSMRTLRRYTVALMKEMNANTRFQAGWLAALRLFANQIDGKDDETNV